MSREAPKSPIKSQERTEGGVISYGPGPTKKTIMYFLKDCDKAPRVGDKVRFNICQVGFNDLFHIAGSTNFTASSVQVKRNKELIATNIQEITNNPHQLQQQTSLNAGESPQQQQQQLLQQQVSLQNMQAPHSPSMNNGNRTIGASNAMKANYANGNIGKAAKIHHGFIAVLKVCRRLLAKTCEF